MDDCTGLENQRGVKASVGSNPTLPATQPPPVHYVSHEWGYVLAGRPPATTFAQRVHTLDNIEDVWHYMADLGFEYDAWGVYGRYCGTAYSGVPVTRDSAVGVLRYLYLTELTDDYGYYSYMSANRDGYSILELALEYTGDADVPSGGRVDGLLLSFPDMDMVEIYWGEEPPLRLHRLLAIAHLVKWGYTSWADLRSRT